MPTVPSGARVERLRAIPLFDGLPDEALARIAEVMTEFEATPGQTLIQSGAPGSGMFMVEEGTVAVERPGRPDIELGPGQFVGELALLSSRGTRVARARARTPSVLLALSREDFDRLLDEEPRIGVAMLRTVAERMVAQAESDA